MSKWLTALTNMAVLAGLVLVAYELNQNSDLARTSLVNQGNAIENDLGLGLMGGRIAEVIALSIECPEKMNYADFVVIDAYLFTAMNGVYRNYEIAKWGLFNQSDWKFEAQAYAHWYLGGSFNRAWWEESKTYFEPEFSSYVDEQLANKGKAMGETWQRLRTRLDLGRPRADSVSSTCKN
jgi:hypothetical protein